MEHGNREVLTWQLPENEEMFVSGGAMNETTAFLQAVERGAGFSPDLREALSAMLVAEGLDRGGDAEVTDSEELHSGAEQC